MVSFSQSCVPNIFAYLQSDCCTTSFHSGKNMLRILDDILLVAKGSHSLNIKEETVNVSDFIRQTVADMTNFAYME